MSTLLVIGLITATLILTGYLTARLSRQQGYRDGYNAGWTDNLKWTHLQRKNRP